VDVRGGAGGARIGAGCNDSRGGAGGDGYLRIDGAAAPPTLQPNVPSTAGPVWAPSAPVIVSVGQASFPFTGEVNRSYVLEVDGVRPGGTSPMAGNNGAGTAQVSFATPGLSELCLGFGPAFSGVREEKSCIFVAVLP